MNGSIIMQCDRRWFRRSLSAFSTGFLSLMMVMCGLVAAEIVTVSPWHTAGNGSYTDAFGGIHVVPNVSLLHRAKAGFGAGVDTNQMVIHSLGFSDLQGVSYTGEPVGNVKISPAGGWTGGVSFYGFDLGVWQTPPLQRDVDYEIWNGDFTSKLASGTVTVGAVRGTVNVRLFSPNGFNVQFESAGVVAIDHYRVEGNDSAAPRPSIAISGNGVVIPHADTTPALADHTDFGAAVLLGQAVTRTFSITNVGDLALQLTGAAPAYVTVSGSSDFAVTAQPALTTLAAAGGSTTFAITFTPSGTGLKTATVNVASNDLTKTPYSFTVSGYWLGFSDGTLDRNFSGDGRVLADFGAQHHEYGRAVAVQTDGKIIVAGTSVPVGGGNGKIALARFTTEGELDATFGTGGLVLTDLSAQSWSEEARAVIVQQDGKIVAGGYAWNGSNYDFVVLRYTPAGALDASFGTAGVAMIPVGSGEDFGQSMALLADGRIVLAGYASSGFGYYEFAMIRLTSAGALDATFGTGGKVITAGNFGSHEIATSMALQSNGQMVLAGSGFQGTGDDFRMHRYNAGGSLDGIFGAGGKVVTSLSSAQDRAMSVQVQPDGKILLAGEVTNGGNADIAVVRYSPFGALDGSFGSGGIVQIQIGTGQDRGRGMVLQSDGKILVVGAAEIGGQSDFAITRLSADGSLDNSFGTGGKVTTELSATNDQAYAVALLPDNRIVAVGEANHAQGHSDFAVAVYGLPVPNIAVAQSAPLMDGVGNVSVGAAALGTAGTAVTFTITNPGNAELADLSIVVDGPHAADFTIGALSANAIPVGTGTATFTVVFSPSSQSGMRNAVLRVLSNVAGEKNPFDIAVSGRALSYAEDSDGDGLNDAAEFRMAVMGFDWEVAQEELVDAYYAAAGGAGLLTEAQIRAQHQPAPMIPRDPDTGTFALVIDIEKSLTLQEESFEHVPISIPQVNVVDGEIVVELLSPEEKAFFRLLAE